MRDQNKGRPPCGMKRKDEIDHLCTRMAIKIAGRLVGEQDFRPRRQRPRQRHPLLLTTGKLCRVVMQTMGQSDLLQGLARPRHGPVSHTGQFKGDGDILHCRHRLDQVKGLKHDPDPAAAETGKRILVHPGQFRAIHKHPPAACPLDTRHHRHQRRLARSRGPQNGHRFTPLYVERDPA